MAKNNSYLINHFWEKRTASETAKNWLFKYGRSSIDSDAFLQTEKWSPYKTDTEVNLNM